MPYTGNPSTSTTDAVRLLIHDLSTSSGSNILQDNEITYFLNQEVNTLYAAAAAAEAAGAKFAGGNSASMTKVGDLALEFGGGNPAESYKVLAGQLRMRANLSLKPFSGGISVSDKQNEVSDTDRVAPQFRVGMHDADASTSTGAY